MALAKFISIVPGLNISNPFNVSTHFVLYYLHGTQTLLSFTLVYSFRWWQCSCCDRAIVDGILLSTGSVVDRIFLSAKCYFDRVLFFDAF